MRPTLILTTAVIVAIGLCGTAVAGPIGGTTPTGEYYEYANFASGAGQVYKGGGDVDTWSRYIYIHGTNSEDRLGQPVSHGCVRLANRDVIRLFDLVQVGDSVLITPT